MHNDLHVKYTSLLQDFSKPWILGTDFREKYIKTSIFMKIRLMGAELLHVDKEGRTDSPT